MTSYGWGLGEVLGLPRGPLKVMRFPEAYLKGAKTTPGAIMVQCRGTYSRGLKIPFVLHSHLGAR